MEMIGEMKVNDGNIAFVIMNLINLKNKNTIQRLIMIFKRFFEM